MRAPYKGIRPRAIGTNSLPPKVESIVHEVPPRPAEPPLPEPFSDTPMRMIELPLTPEGCLIPPKEEIVEESLSTEEQIIYNNILTKLKEIHGEKKEIPLETKYPPITNVQPTRDVHVYDHQFTEVRYQIPKYSRKLQSEVFLLLQKFVHQEAIAMLEIFNRFQGNMDDKNCYDAGELLVYFLEHASGEDWLSLLEEQLIDNYRLGQCPQGRVIRLLSLIGAFC